MNLEVYAWDHQAADYCSSVLCQPITASEYFNLAKGHSSTWGAGRYRYILRDENNKVTAVFYSNNPDLYKSDSAQSGSSDVVSARLPDLW